MKKYMTYGYLGLCVAVICFVAVTPLSEQALSKYGSRGNEVKQIQTKLAKWGYYKDKIDSIYGYNTKRAVMSYQRRNGLTADGVAGTNTLKKMGISTSGSSNNGNNSNNNGNNNSNNSNNSGGESGGNKHDATEAEAKMLARIINAEARGESYQGQVAVGAVVLNRVKHPSFPNSISGVIYQPGAFTAISDGQWDAAMYQQPYQAAKDALNGYDPTYGAIYYYNPAKTTNKWIYSRPIVTKIGNHVFCK